LFVRAAASVSAGAGRVWAWPVTTEASTTPANTTPRVENEPLRRGFMKSSCELLYFIVTSVASSSIGASCNRPSRTSAFPASANCGAGSARLT